MGLHCRLRDRNLLLVGCRDLLVSSLDTTYSARWYTLILDEIDRGLVAMLGDRLMPRNRMHGSYDKTRLRDVPEKPWSRLVRLSPSVWLVTRPADSFDAFSVDAAW